MNLPKPGNETQKPSRAPKNAVRMMVIILVAMGLLAIYANVQKLRRSAIEEVKITTQPTSSPSPEAR